MLLKVVANLDTNNVPVRRETQVDPGYLNSQWPGIG